MSRTALSVPTHVRDTFAAVAASRNTTMLALLDEAASRLEREETMRQATESYERLAREDPEAFADYLAEGRQWDELASDGLPSAGVQLVIGRGDVVVADLSPTVSQSRAVADLSW